MSSKPSPSKSPAKGRKKPTTEADWPPEAVAWVGDLVPFDFHRTSAPGPAQYQNTSSP